jgi:class 3 adenylate cyclase
LPSLTVEDLKDLGVTLVGDRRRLLDAIAALSKKHIQEPQVEPSEGIGRSLAPTGGTAAAEAERRQLTVMFCDLVGSTPLATRFDPEDLREIVGAYHRCVTDTVVRFGGFVAKYMGDGVLIYFGYPEAHEDDAERAARAGLGVIDAVGRLATQEPLNVRIGIATGLVVVGDLIGAGAAQERGVVGETPNLAARLQALARPDTLVVADSTRRQIGTLFEIEDLGPQPLAGADQAACQQNAAAQLSPAVAAANYQAVGGALLGGALGAGLGAGIGAAAGNAGKGAGDWRSLWRRRRDHRQRGWRALSAGVAAAAVRHHVRAVHGRPRELCRQPLPAPRRRALFRKILDLLWRPLALITLTLHPHLAFSTQTRRRRRRRQEHAEPVVRIHFPPARRLVQTGLVNGWAEIGAWASIDAF